MVLHNPIMHYLGGEVLYSETRITQTAGDHQKKLSYDKFEL